MPMGGPSGGNGGRGGNVVFVATKSENTLLSLRFRPRILAGHGNAGEAGRRTGAQGDDVVVMVPVGTVIRDSADGTLLADMSSDGQEFVVLRGGRGGLGNMNFATPTRQAPDFAEPGEPGQEADLDLELRLLADVGLLGFPNAGKSTLISRVSAARPKVADYPFTTLEPSLGVVQVPGTYQTFVMADIPGLIEGAAEGVGLGHRFLRHVDRCRILLHLIALDPTDELAHGDVVQRYDTIMGELRRWEGELATRPQIILLSKTDLVLPEEAEAARTLLTARGLEVFCASAVSGDGIHDLIFRLAKAVTTPPGAAG